MEAYINTKLDRLNEKQFLVDQLNSELDAQYQVMSETFSVICKFK